MTEVKRFYEPTKLNKALSLTHALNRLLLKGTCVPDRALKGGFESVPIQNERPTQIAVIKSVLVR